MEDFFNVFRSRGGRFPVDQKLEALLLRGFDTLALLLKSLESPQGLTEEVSKTAIAEVEPIFEETEQHIQLLLGETSAPPPATVATVPDLNTVMTERVPRLLREMLDLFKRREDPSSREQLIQVTQSLQDIGKTYELNQWQQLTQAVKDVLALPNSDLRNLALIALRDLKQAQQLVLQGQAESIRVSTELLKLADSVDSANRVLKQQPSLSKPAPEMTEAQKRIQGFFLLEAREHLALIEQSLMTLDKNCGDSEFIAELFRGFHSIKGGGAQLGLVSIQKVSHRLEDFFSLFRSHLGEIPVDDRLKQLLLRGYDALSRLIDHVETTGYLDPDFGQGVWDEIEPVFTETEHYIHALMEKRVEPEPVLDLAAMHQDIRHLLRQLLDKFKSSSLTPSIRSGLIEDVQKLRDLGVRYHLPQWVELVDVVHEVLNQSTENLSTLALPILRDLKQGHQALLNQALDEIKPSSELLALLPQPDEPEVPDFDSWLTETADLEPASSLEGVEDDDDSAFLTWESNEPSIGDFGDLFTGDVSTEALLSNQPSGDFNWGDDFLSSMDGEDGFQPPPLELGDDDESVFADLFSQAEELAAIEAEPSLNLIPGAASYFADEDKGIAERIGQAKADGDLAGLFAEVTEGLIPETSLGFEVGSSSDLGDQSWDSFFEMTEGSAEPAPVQTPVQEFEEISEEMFDTIFGDSEEETEAANLWIQEANGVGEQSSLGDYQAEGSLSFEDIFAADFMTSPSGEDPSIDAFLSAETEQWESSADLLDVDTAFPLPEESSFESLLSNDESNLDKLDSLFTNEINALDELDFTSFTLGNGTSSVDLDGDGQVDLDELTRFLEEEPLEELGSLAAGFDPLLEDTALDVGITPLAEEDPLAQLEQELATLSSEPDLDNLEALLSDLEPAPKPVQKPIQKAVEKPIVQIQPAAAPATSRTAAFNTQFMRVEVRYLDTVNNLVGEMVVNRNSMDQNQSRLRQSLDGLLSRVQELGELSQRLQDQYDRSLLEASLQGVRSTISRYGSDGNKSQSSHYSGQEFTDLEMDRYTDFHRLSQEIIELIVRVRESSSDIEFGIDEAEQVARQFRQVTSQLQEGLNRIRMVPFSQTADQLPGAIRQLTYQTGKQAVLVVEGRDTPIDKAIQEKLTDPLRHLANNALVHGIESPEERKRAGKPVEGRITVRAFYQGNQSIIVVSDDGAGIPVEKVKQKALRLGLISPDADIDEVYNVLFHPGFSGRSETEVDDLAGRGVGLDVVRRNITELRGTIQVDSTPGKGTSFTIRLPLTLSISKAMVCVSDKALVAFPLDGVEEMLDIPIDRIRLDEKGRPSVPWRDQYIHYQPLSNLLRYSRSYGRVRSEVYSISQDEGIIPIVILQSSGQYVALQVDSFVEEQEIVIKQLRGPVHKPTGIAGATVLGNGRVLPIADIIELVDLAQGRVRHAISWSDEDIPEQPEVAHQTTVLIIDDSVTVRELLSMTFNKVGYRVEQARDGQDAWEKLRGGLPCDLIFCDIEMPRMDGLELLSRLREDETLKNLPIAMLTSRGAERHRQTARDLGATAYFTKPYLEEELLSAATRMLRGERLLLAAN
jgi:chemosensory pili system protein ChpA (sensor histidine kinase/response regulator)